MHPHPASLIFFWLALLLLVSTLSGLPLFSVSGLLLLVAILAARTHLRQLLRRSRWLLIMIVVLFGWMTPGIPVSYLPGASSEGLRQGLEQAARLLLALASLALMLRMLRPVALVAGMRALLVPLALLGSGRDRIAVRVALTLEAVESPGIDSAPDGWLHLPRFNVGVSDAALLVCSLFLIVRVVWP